MLFNNVDSLFCRGVLRLVEQAPTTRHPLPCHEEGENNIITVDSA